MGTYLDALIDENMNVLFNSTPDNMKEFLKGRGDTDNSKLRVCLGQTLKFVTIDEYLSE